MVVRSVQKRGGGGGARVGLLVGRSKGGIGACGMVSSFTGEGVGVWDGRFHLRRVHWSVGWSQQCRVLEVVGWSVVAMEVVAGTILDGNLGS